jgi:hypothetical protein
MKLLRYLYRSFRWWLKCLWAGKVEPRKEVKLFSRSHMRKSWSDRLVEVDRAVNLNHRSWRNLLRSLGREIEREKRDGSVNLDTGYPEWISLLRERRLMVAKRRAFRFE